MAEVVLLRFEDNICNKMATGLVNRGHNVRQINELNELYDELKNRHAAIVVINFLPEEKWPYLAATKIRQTPGISYTKILAITPKVSIAQTDKIFSTGVNECLNRPFKMGTFLDKVQQTIEDTPKDAVKPVPKDQPPIPPNLLECYNTICKVGRKLGDVAELNGGIAAQNPKARRVVCPGPEWTPAVIDEAVNQYFLGEEREFFLLRKDLMRRLPKEDEYKVDEKLIVKRTVLPVSAAVDYSGLPFVAGLYGVQTVKGLLCGYLCAVLNSRYTQFFFNRFRKPSEGLRGVYLSRKDFEDLPIIIPEVAIQKRIAKMSQELSNIPAHSRNASRMIERGKMLAEINREIFTVFGFTDAAIKELTDMHF